MVPPTGPLCLSRLITSGWDTNWQLQQNLVDAARRRNYSRRLLAPQARSEPEPLACMRRRQGQRMIHDVVVHYE